MGDYLFGYAATDKGRDRDVEPIKTEQKAASRIVELRQAGRFYREIATALDAEGNKPRRAVSWSAAAVRNVAMGGDCRLIGRVGNRDPRHVSPCERRR